MLICAVVIIVFCAVFRVLNIYRNLQPLHQCKMPQKERRKCTLSIKMSPASGGFAAWTPDQGLCPWTPLGAPPQTPFIGSRSALAIVPSKLNSLCSTNFFLKYVLLPSLYGVLIMLMHEHAQCDARVSMERLPFNELPPAVASPGFSSRGTTNMFTKVGIYITGMYRPTVHKEIWQTYTLDYP